MRIEHVGLWTDDLERLCAFYERWFRAKRGTRYENPATGFSSVFLSFPDGARLEAMHRAGAAPRPADGSIGYAHLAFAVGDRFLVDMLAAELVREGVPVLDGPRETGDGYYELVITDPDGNRVEVMAG